MKIYKLNNFNFKADFIEMIRDIMESDKADKDFLRDLLIAVDYNKDLTNEQFAVLYYITALHEEFTDKQNNASVFITTADELHNVNDRINKINIYTKMKQNLYISLILSKENGLKFAKGSLDFTEKEYTDFNNSIIEEIHSFVSIASKRLGIDL